ncbi:MAG: hypothetical protein H6821_08265 [Planctomycetaceae bacterium]|nr:hypothetical protein [Planctomycetales bacterium]MCB9874161.1 hypothetical protein [Planctomycetaceae bacterium]
MAVRIPYTLTGVFAIQTDSESVHAIEPSYPIRTTLMLAASLGLQSARFLKYLPPGQTILRVHLDNATLYAIDFN